MSSRTHTRKLAELQERELKAKQAERAADLAALNARNEAEQAEQLVIRAHAGHGELRKAERALAKADAQVKDTALRAKGAALRLEEIQTEIAGYKATHFRELIAESEPDAARPVELLRQGMDLILEGDALWQAHAQLVGGYLIAAGHRPNENMAGEHALTETARQLRRFDAATLSPPLPHGYGMAIREQEEATARQMRRESAAA